MYTIFNLKKDMGAGKQLVIGHEHWGKCAWSFIYNTVLAYKGDISHLRKFLKNLKHVLPCEECKVHYTAFLKENAIPKNLHKIFQWCVKLENKIAKENYKEKYIPINRLTQILTPDIAQKDTATDSRPSGTKLEQTSADKTKVSRVSTINAPCVNCNKDRMARSLKHPSMVNMGAAMPYDYGIPLGYSRKI